MEQCNAAARSLAFTQLVAAYSEPHRHYHTLDHIDALLAYRLQAEQAFGPEAVSLELAVWYHDVVYDPRRQDNESRSAAWARTALANLGIGEARLARVCEMILMTKDHEAPEQDPVARFFLDADLSILSADPIRYAEYAAQIRQEYAWVADCDYCVGRRAVLQGFLQWTAIFRTAWFRHGELAARRNLAAEIAQLDERRRTLPS